MHEVLHFRVGILYRDEQKARLYQNNLFETFRKSLTNKARMNRNLNRGHLRDSWEFTNSGDLISYTEYFPIKITDVHDTGKLTGLGIQEYLFLDGGYDSDVLNHLMRHLGNIEGISKHLDNTLLEEYNGPRYTNNM